MECVSGGWWRGRGRPLHSTLTLKACFYSGLTQNAERGRLDPGDLMFVCMFFGATPLVRNLQRGFFRQF